MSCGPNFGARKEVHVPGHVVPDSGPLSQLLHRYISPPGSGDDRRHAVLHVVLSTVSGAQYLLRGHRLWCERRSVPTEQSKHF